LLLGPGARADGPTMKALPAANAEVGFGAKAEPELEAKAEVDPNTLDGCAWASDAKADFWGACVDA
jgi:hypothetical protein